MFKDAFIKLDAVQAAKGVERINPHLDMTFDPQSATVMIHDLTFYKGYFLAEVADHTQSPPVIRVAVCNSAGDVTPLDWTNEPIFHLNVTVPIQLDSENIHEYVRFFFGYVRGQHGRFLVIDNVDDIDWREEPAPAGRKALGRMIESLRIKSREPDGSFMLQASLIFRDSLFQAEVHVRPDGAISLKNEELLVDDIPVADDIFGQ